jgi:prepilin peptidase CpaA
MFSIPPRGALMVLTALLVGAAIFDIRYRRIPNWLTLSGVIAGILLNWFIGPPEGGLLYSLAGLGGAFAIYLFLYLLRAMGAGDVKLMAAVGSLVGLERWFGIFFVTAIVGGIMALMLIVVRGRARKTLWNVGFILNEMRYGRPAYVSREELDVRSGKAVGLPHGAVIAVGTIFYIALSARLLQ